MSNTASLSRVWDDWAGSVSPRDYDGLSEEQLRETLTQQVGDLASDWDVAPGDVPAIVETLVAYVLEQRA